MVRSSLSLVVALFLAFAAAACFSQNAPSQSSAPAASQAPASSSAAAADVDEDDDSPDIPAFAHGRISEREYLQLRDQQLRLQRGLDDLLKDPQARSRALRTMQIQEESLRRMLSRSAASGVPPLPPASWTPLGPAPIPNGQTSPSVSVSGRVTAIAVDPTDPNIVYVGTAQGGLYRTTSGGAAWTPLMDAANSLAIGAITIDPTDHTIVFVGTGESSLSLDSFFGVGLYIITSANTAPVLNGPFNSNGTSDIFTARSISRILVNPSNHNLILVSTTSGFSGASGDTSNVLPPRGVYLSTNVFTPGPAPAPTFSLVTIQSTANRSTTDMAMDPGNVNKVVVNVFGTAAAGDGGIWTVTAGSPWNGTATWTQEITKQAIGKLAVNRSGSPTPATTFIAAFDESSGCTGAGSGAGGTMSKSGDGITWSAVPAAAGFCGGQCFYDMAPAIDPSNANNILLGGSAIPNRTPQIGTCGSGIMGKSTTGGTSFSPSQADLHADSHATTFAPSNPSIVYAGNDGGIFSSSDGGSTWTSLNNGTFSATQFESIAVHPTDPNFTIGGTQDNGTPFLQPDGVTWTRADFGDGGFSAIDQNATNTTNVTMYHTYFNQKSNLIGFARVLSTPCASDGQWSFNGIYTGPVDPAVHCDGTSDSFNGVSITDDVLFYAPLALGPGNPNTVYFGSDRLYRSTNQGTAMTVVSQAPLAAGFPISAIGVSPLSDSVRIVGLGNNVVSPFNPSGKVFATTTGSSTLTDVTGPWTVKYIARTVIDPNNPNTAYVTLDGYGAATGHVWKTTNLSAGTPTFTSMSSGIPDVPVNGFAVDPQNSNNLYAGTDIGVYNSVDGGTTWNPYGTGLPRVAVFDLKITAGRKVRIATHGRGMWEIVAVSPGTATTLTASSNPPSPNVGQNVTISGTVNHSAAPVPTGTVVFMDGATLLGSGALNGSGVASFSTTTLALGSHTIVAAYAGDSTYAASQGNVTVNVIGPDYTVTIPTGTATVKAGTPATYTVTIGALNGFAGTVNFTCTAGLPSLTNCSFNPASVTGNGSTTMTISTAAPTAAPPSGNLSSGLLTGGGFLALGVVLAGVTTRKRRGWKSAFLLLGMLVLIAFMASCGGGGGGTPPVVHNPGTPAGTYSVTVSATSGAITHTSNITLVVQ